MALPVEVDPQDGGNGERLRAGLRDLAWAVVSSLAFAAIVIARRHGDWARGLVPFRGCSIFYNAPAVVPFVLFLQARLRRRDLMRPARTALDAAIVLLAASRMVVHVPYISGHALFLSYGLLTTRTLLVRAAMAVVLLGTAIVKIFVWHDVSLVGGCLLGVATAFVWLRCPAH